MRNFLKLILLCLLLLITACQNHSASPKLQGKTSDNTSEVSVSFAKLAQLDGEKIESLLLLIAADTQELNVAQTRHYFEKMATRIKLECRQTCEIKLLKELP